jgi:hypothetical protein
MKKAEDCCKHAYFLLLFSPLAWIRCFNLIFIRTYARSRWAALIHYSTVLIVLLLIAVWCYLYYYLTLDGGMYLNMLSNAAANISTISDGRSQFNSLIWKTILRTFGMAILFGIIQALNIVLVAIWRQRICDLLQNLLLR